MTTKTIQVWVVRDASGEYIAEGNKRTPSGDEAKEFGSREAAVAACDRATDKPLARYLDVE